MHWSKNQKLREEVISRMKAKLKGRPAWNKGIPHSDEAKHKNRIKHLGKKCSEETRLRMSEAHKSVVHEGMFKKGNIPWNKGRNVARKIERSLLRDKILERDKCCKICGNTKANVIHHIKPFESFEDHAEENLVLLCRSCHQSLHMSKENGRPYRKDLLK